MNRNFILLVPNFDIIWCQFCVLLPCFWARILIRPAKYGAINIKPCSVERPKSTTEENAHIFTHEHIIFICDPIPMPDYLLYQLSITCVCVFIIRSTTTFRTLAGVVCACALFYWLANLATAPTNGPSDPIAFSRTHPPLYRAKTPRCSLRKTTRSIACVRHQRVSTTSRTSPARHPTTTTTTRVIIQFTRLIACAQLGGIRSHTHTHTAAATH